MIDFSLGLVDFSGHRGHLFGSTTKNNWRVGFRNSKATNDPEGSSEDGHKSSDEHVRNPFFLFGVVKTYSTHRQPFDSPRNPPAIGPITGPKNGAAAKILIATPR